MCSQQSNLKVAVFAMRVESLKPMAFAGTSASFPAPIGRSCPGDCWKMKFSLTAMHSMHNDGAGHSHTLAVCCCPVCAAIYSSHLRIGTQGCKRRTLMAAGSPVPGGIPRAAVACLQDVQRAHQRSHRVRRAARGKDQLGQAHAQRQEGDVKTYTGAAASVRVSVSGQSVDYGARTGSCLALTDVC